MSADDAGIDTRGLYINSAMRRLALHLTGSPKAALDEPTGTWYLGAGYWRAIVTGEPGNKRIRLLNPSYTQNKINVVEQAMNIVM